tara:strand:+ start:1045 stop:1170 length:126 start_codon:yes stop_codon:yes gene_type:complete
MISYWIKFKVKDFKENPNLVKEMLEYEHKFNDIKENYEKID